MRASTSLLICCWGLLLGCPRSRFVSGQGDAGLFMLRHAVAYGARPVATNGLPVIAGEWQYSKNEHGIVIVFPATRYGEVDSFLLAAFGSRSGISGWTVRDMGVAIEVQQTGTVTLVRMHPPTSGFNP